jgi:hypothetical protein
LNITEPLQLHAGSRKENNGTNYKIFRTPLRQVNTWIVGVAFQKEAETFLAMWSTRGCEYFPWNPMKVDGIAESTGIESFLSELAQLFDFELYIGTHLLWQNLLNYLMNFKS